MAGLCFDTAIPGASYLLIVAVVLFAFSPMLSWSYYGLRAWVLLFGRGRLVELSFKVIFLIFPVLGLP